LHFSGDLQTFDAKASMQFYILDHIYSVKKHVYNFQPGSI